jgi:hypothetical protein
LSGAGTPLQGLFTYLLMKSLQVQEENRPEAN